MATKSKSGSKSVVLDSNGYKYYENIDDSDDEGPPIRHNLSVASPKKTSPAFQSSSKLISNGSLLNNEATIPSATHGDITEDLNLLEFEAGLDQDQIRLARVVRLHCHASYVYACAHATFFVGHANKLRSTDFESIYARSGLIFEVS
jgi:hypothetical protein